jgi:hypothetical protein
MKSNHNKYTFLNGGLGSFIKNPMEESEQEKPWERVH